MCFFFKKLIRKLNLKGLGFFKGWFCKLGDNFIYLLFWFFLISYCNEIFKKLKEFFFLKKIRSCIIFVNIRNFIVWKIKFE